MIKPVEKASILIEALPYIRNFYGKTIVIKYGGNVIANEELKNNIMKDIVLMKFVGMKPVIVHGGGAQISDLLKRIGKETEFVQGLRVTDKETAGIAEMVLAGSINKEIVSLINRLGGKAVGLCGKDANLISVNKKFAQITSETGETEMVDIGYVGEIIEVNSRILIDLEENGYIPVVAPNGVDENGETYNVNADSVAGKIAASLKAEKLILLTDVTGILRDREDDSSLISTLCVSEIDELIKKKVIGSGMLPKVEACITALEGSVTKTHIIDGREPHSLLLEIFTKEGIGTEIVTS